MYTEALRETLTSQDLTPADRFCTGLSALLVNHPYERRLRQTLLPLAGDTYLHTRVNLLFEHDGTAVLGLHSMEVGIDAASLGMIYGMPGREILECFRAGALHDIGKLGVRTTLLHLPRTLTPEERAEMRTHPTYAKAYLHREYSPAAWEAAHGHHEDTYNERGEPVGYPRRYHRRTQQGDHSNNRRLGERRTSVDLLVSTVVGMIRVTEVAHALKDPRRPYRHAPFAGKKLREEVEIIFKGNPICMRHFGNLETIAQQIPDIPAT